MNKVRSGFLKRRLVRNLLALTFVTAGVVGTVLLVGGYRTVGLISERAIEQAVDRTESELMRFFGPVESTLAMAHDWGQAGDLELSFTGIEELNRRFRPLLERNSQVTSVLVADSSGREYMLLQQGESWVNRFIDEDYATGAARWIRWDGDGQELESWQDELEYRMRERPWYTLAMTAEAGEAVWTAPYTFFTTQEPGITTSMRFESPHDQNARVVALDVLLTDVSTFTTAMRPSQNGYIAVLSPTGKVIGLPAQAIYDDEEVIRRDVLSAWSDLGMTDTGEAWRMWQQGGRSDSVVTSRSDELGTYQAGFRPFTLGELNLTVATVVPRKDLTGAMNRQRNLAGGLTLVALSLALVVAVRTSRDYDDQIAEVVDAVQSMGQYTLDEMIGSGGMGEIYRAHHAMLQRPTAVKLLKPELYDEVGIERFAREVRLSCQLTHPNTVTIFDYGETDDGQFYYAMELLEGVTLTELIEYTGPLPEGRVIYLLRQICGSLAEAHGIGLLHRDVKPGNIMVGDQGGVADRIKVLDFGLVKDIHAPDEVDLTDQEYLQGSPGYMAPEIILGNREETPAVDVFAVGAVGYNLLCGTAPFEGDSAIKVMLAQINEDPPSPSEVLGREVDAGLEALIIKCMEKSPSQRIATIVEVDAALARCQAAAEWGQKEARAWWNHYGHDVRPAPLAEADRGSKAFHMTVSLSQKDRQETIAGAPEPLLGVVDTEESTENA